MTSAPGPGPDPFRALYDANQLRVRALLTRMVGREHAEDLTQVVFAKAAKALPDFRGDARASTWLYRIAANVASDWLHSRSAHEAELTERLDEGADEGARSSGSRPVVPDGLRSPEQELAQKDMRDCLRGEIAKLSDTYRTIFMLSELGGLDDAEIAQTLGITRANAKVRLHRARQEFRKIIAARCDFYSNELSCKPASADCCPSEPPPANTTSSR